MRCHLLALGVRISAQVFHVSPAHHSGRNAKTAHLQLQVGNVVREHVNGRATALSDARGVVSSTHIGEPTFGCHPSALGGVRGDGPEPFIVALLSATQGPVRAEDVRARRVSAWLSSDMNIQTPREAPSS